MFFLFRSQNEIILLLGKENVKYVCKHQENNLEKKIIKKESLFQELDYDF
jgi:hypothetical protein